jgi:ketosteroid isomerase-like protein
VEEIIMKADAEIRAEVLAVFKGLWKAYQEKDLAGVLSFYVPDPDLLLLGTGVDERYAGMRAVTRGLRRDFSQSQGVRVKMTKVSVSAAGKVAWVASNLQMRAVTDQGEVILEGRLTAVLERRRKNWLIAQSHLSVPMAGQEAGQSFPMP